MFLLGNTEKTTGKPEEMEKSIKMQKRKKYEKVYQSFRKKHQKNIQTVV